MTFTYDNIGQLKVAYATNAAGSALTSERFGYNYDAAWNLNQRTNNGTTSTFSVNSQNQLTSVPAGSPTYDNNGNITSDATRSFSYDDENQLTSVSSGTSYKNDFVYDGFGRLRKKLQYIWTGSSWSLYVETRYIYDGMRVIQELDGSNVPSVAYTRGWDLSGSWEGAGGIGGLLGRSHGYSAGNWSTHHSYHADGSGNITAMADSSQALSASYRYDSFGNTVSSSGGMAGANLYRFSSKEINPSANLYYYGYRFYHPDLQRWLNRDPIEERGGINLYGFVNNSPITIYDLLGLKFKVCVRSGDGHAWIYAKNLDTGEEHTYGRWRKGYGGTKPAGVSIDVESSGKNKNKYKDFSERCVIVDCFKPTITPGFGLEKPGEEYIPGWHDRKNNCVTYACSEWHRVSGESLEPGFLYNNPTDFRESIDQWNRHNGNPDWRAGPGGGVGAVGAW